MDAALTMLVNRYLAVVRINKAEGEVLASLRCEPSPSGAADGSPIEIAYEIEEGSRDWPTLSVFLMPAEANDVFDADDRRVDYLISHALPLIEAALTMGDPTHYESKGG